MNAEELGVRYLGIKDQIKALEDEAKVVKGLLENELKDLDLGTSYETEKVVVTHVNGRTVKKLSKVKLVKLGVTQKVLEAATETSVYPATFRVVAPKADNGSPSA